MKIAITTLATCVAALLMLGLVMLYSSSMNMPDKTKVNVIGANLLKTQTMWCALGLVACAVAASLDYRLLRKFALPIFVIAVVLLAVVLLPIPDLCKRINGARRWFNFGGISFQPSEMAKLALIIMLAWY